MRTALRKMGNSAGVIVPKAILNQLGVGLGTSYNVSVEGERIVFDPVSATEARAGSEPVALVDSEEAELNALAEELDAAASRMAERLDAASAAVRRALDPEREVELRRHYEAEFAGDDIDILAHIG